MKHDVLQGPTLKPLPSTRTDNKVMRLVLKKYFLFIHQLQCGHHQSTSLVPAHTFSSGAAIVLAFLECSLWDVI